MQIFELFGSISLKDSGVEDKLDKIDKKASQTDKNMDSSFGKIGSSALKLGAILGTGLGITGLIKKSFEYATSASDLSEAQNVLSTTFKVSGKAIEAWTNTTTKSAGISKTNSTQWAGFMGAMLKSSGVAEESSTTMSKSLVQLTGDMSSFYNVSTSDMWEKLRSGISGETEPLKAIGINMSVANLQAYALAEGIKKPYAQMSQGEQTQLRYNYLMNVTKDAQGDFGKTLSTSFANQVRVAKLGMEDMGRSIGTKLLPYFMEATQWINSNMPQIQNVITKVMDNIIGAVKLVAPVFKDWIVLIGQIVKELLPSFGKASDDAQVKTSNLVKNGLDLVTTALTWIRDNIGLVKFGIEALTVVWVAQQVALLVHNIALGVHNGLQFVKMIQDKGETFYLWLLIAADNALAIAQWAVNVAMDANPIGLIILALAALGLAIYEVVKHWKDIVEWIEKAWKWLNQWNGTKMDGKSASVKIQEERISGDRPLIRGGYASGTDYATPGAHWVGENGPEIVNFKGGETVTNAEESKRLANNSNSQPIIIITQLDGREIARTIVEPMSQELQKFDKKQSYNVGGTY